MARNDNIGALGGLGGFTDEEFGEFSQGLQASNNSLGKAFGVNVTPTDVLTSAIGFAAPAISAPLSIGNIMGQYNVNQLSNRAMGRPTDVLSGFSRKSFQDLQKEIDVNKDRNITEREIQNFGMSKGRTAYGVGLNPMSGYKPNTITKDVLSPFGSKATQTTSDRDDTGRGDTGDVTSYYSPFGPGVNTTSGMGVTDSKGQSVTDSKGQNVTQTPHTDNDAASEQGSTYICTALYEMGDMKKSIYKYDQVYGKRVDPNVYRGYCLWGKYVATKLRYKGIVYKIAKPLALAWAKQMAFDLSKGRYGKKSRVVKVISKIGEGVCYALGVIANIKIKKGVRYG